MRNLILLSLVSGFCVTHLSADSIQYSVTNLSGDEWQYTYYLTGTYSDGIATDNQAIDIQFDASTTALFNAVAEPSSSWTAEALAPLPGSPYSDYYLQAVLGNTDPSTAGPFTVDFDYSPIAGDPATPGAQEFTVYQFSNSTNESVVLSGYTTLQQTDPVPEPASFVYSSMGLLVLAAYKAMRRKASESAQ